MAREGFPLDRARIILRNAGILQRAAEVDCSISHEGIRASSERGAKRAADAILAAVGEGMWSVTLHGDPRGYVVHLHMGPGHDVPVPAQGYSASQMDRMLVASRDR
jgi:hypothetical protein